MHNFDLKKITAVKGVQTFYQLTIDDQPDFSRSQTEEERNECKTGVLDTFQITLEEYYQKDLRMIYSYMDRNANNQPIAGNKYHELSRLKKDPIKDYEFKHGDIRVYSFKIPGGKVFAVAGCKNNQKRDIELLRSLKKQYYEQHINNLTNEKRRIIKKR